MYKLNNPLPKYKSNIKKYIRKFGWDIKRIHPDTSDSEQLSKALNFYSIDTIFDIGANIGQFAKELREVGFCGRIISFEPLPLPYKSLVMQSKMDPKWDIHPQAAIGDFDGIIDIHISGNSLSSSILPMLDAHIDAAKNSGYIDVATVPISRIDSVATEYLTGTEKLFLKIDTQGYESKVLDGGSETLSKACGIMCELSLINLYEGQILWLEMIERLEDEGFILWGIQRGFTDPINGRGLQLDGIFFRK
jgi:FkbM family methyltransferase